MPQGRNARIVALIILLCLLALGWWLLVFTQRGQLLIHDPHAFARDAHVWVHHHRIIAPAVLCALYVVLTVLAMPVWWLQVIAGFAFGIWMGIFWCDLAATLGAVCVLSISRWLAADWFHKKVEARMAKLRGIDHKLGHNGFLVVMLVRLSHVAPFALSNYMFGLIEISARDVAIGTMLGGLPSITATVMLGHNPHAYETLRFWAILLTMNVVLLAPVLLRYLRPGWFKKIGVE